MAQEKNMNEKPKRTRRSKVKDESLPVEQITELMLVQNKNDPKAGVRAVSEIDGLLVHLVIVDGHADQTEMCGVLELAPEILDEIFENARILVEFQE